MVHHVPVTTTLLAGRIIAALRVTYVGTQDDLAQRASVAKQSLARVEQGKQVLSFDMVWAIEEVLRPTVPDFRYGSILELVHLVIEELAARDLQVVRPEPRTRGQVDNEQWPSPTFIGQSALDRVVARVLDRHLPLPRAKGEPDGP